MMIISKLKWKCRRQKENMDIMSEAPSFEQILGYKCFIPFSLAGKVLCSALMRAVYPPKTFCDSAWMGCGCRNSAVVLGCPLLL